MSLRSALTRNWTLKLTSLTLAVVLWLVAAADEPGTASVPVRIAVQAPPGRTLLHPPEAVTAIVTGPRGDLFRLASEQLVVIRTLPDTATRQVELEIGPNDVDLPPGMDVRVHDVHPRRLTLELDAVETRRVPVRPMLLHVPADSGRAIGGGIRVEPATVEITGPREQVLRIDTVYTLPLELDFDDPSEQRLRVDTTGLDAVRVTPQVVTVIADLEQVGERTLGPVAVNLPSGLAESLQAGDGAVRVVVRGRPSRLAGLTADSVVVTLAGGPGPDGRAALRVSAPAGLRADATPDSIGLVPRAP